MTTSSLNNYQKRLLPLADEKEFKNVIILANSPKMYL